MALGLTPKEIIDSGRHPLLECSKEWERIELKEIADVQNGYAFKSEHFNHETGVPLIRIRDVGKSKTEELYSGDYEDDYLVNKDDILIGMDGDFRAAYWMGEPGLLNQRVCRIRNVDDSYSKKFLFYLLQPYLNAIHAETSAVTVKHLSSRTIESIPLPKPPLPTQNHIVEKIEELFSELDNGVENLKKAQKQLKTYRQAVLKDAFVGKLTKEWREQQDHLPTPEELLRQIKAERKAHRQRELAEWEKEVEKWEKDGRPGRKPRKPSKPKKLPQITEDDLSSLPDIPSTWRYTYLYDLGDLGRGKSKHRPRNDDKLFNDGTIPFIQTGEVKAASKYLRTFEDTYNEFGLSQSKLWPKGTLCITIAANIAETAILDIDACFPDSIVGYTSYASITDKLFVFYFIQSVQKRLEAFAPATAQKNINLTTLENLLVPLCSLKEQNEIVNEIESRLSVVDQLEQTIKDNLQKAEALRQSILKKAFGGELVL